MVAPGLPERAEMEAMEVTVRPPEQAVPDLPAPAPLLILEAVAVAEAPGGTVPLLVELLVLEVMVALDICM